MDLSKIMTISGKPGLYELVSQTKGGAIVESLIDHRRVPVFAHDRISSLNEISMYTLDNDKPLREIFQDCFRLQEGKPVPIDHKKASGKEVLDFFAQVLPNYDYDRVHTSDVKKFIAWYNLLVGCGKIDLEAPEAPAETEEPQA